MSRMIISLFAIGLLVLAGCGSRSAAQPGTPTTAPEAGEAAAAPGTTIDDSQQSPSAAVVARAQAEGAQVGGTLVRLWGDPPTLNPHLTTDVTSATIIVEIFGGLVTLDTDLNIVGDLAERWDISDDGTSYTFHLRRDARFQDGKPVTANDVKWSLERATDPATQSPVVDQYLGDILGVKEKLNGDATELSGVQVVDAHTLRIDIDAPKSYILAKLTYPTAFVLDREQVESDPRWDRHPNATGPFRLAEYEVGVSLVLERNEFYHLGPPFLDRVRFILSGGTAMLMYENDEIQITGVGLADLDRVLDPSSSLNVELQRVPPSFDTQYIGLNVGAPPLDDPKVRQALNYAINKEEIARVVLGDLVVSAKGIIPPGFPGYDPTIEGYEYNPEKARQLLAESKYGDNLEDYFPLILTTPGAFGANVGLPLQVIQAMWEEIGIKVEPQQTDFAVYLQDLQNRLFQMFEIGWIADYPDPENFLDILFHSESSNNHTGYSNPAVDALLEQARVGPAEERYELYHQIERIIVEEAPWIPLWHGGEQYILVKPQVKDYYQTRLVIPKLRYVYITEE